MKKQNILMLGWEFPPVINGGLGIACLGLSKALSKLANLKVILPKTDPAFILDNIELIGLNNLQLENIKRMSLSSYQHYKNISEEVHEVEISINPYGSPYIDALNTKNFGEIGLLNKKSEKRKGNLNRFQVDELYGTDVKNKVHDYAEYAASLASKMDFEVIHCHDWMTFVAGMEVKSLTGKPLVLHVHSLEYDRAGEHSRSWTYELEKEAMSYADAVVPVSNYTGSIASSHYGIKEDKIFPVHNGVDPVKPFRRDKPFPEKLVLFLGRITRQKGPEFFLELADKVLSKEKNVRFVMAGTGDLFKGIIENSAWRKLGNKFHFTGFLNRDKVNDLFAMADVYCMPSLSEPFGLSALEAVQFGVPSVISKQSGAAEVLEEALVADFWDTDLMADQIVSLLNDEKLKNRVVKSSYENISRYTWENAASKVKNIYEMVR